MSRRKACRANIDSIMQLRAIIKANTECSTGSKEKDAWSGRRRSEEMRLKFNLNRWVVLQAVKVRQGILG